MNKAICLVVVSRGMAEVYEPLHVDCRVVDLDNLEDAYEDIPTLPAGIGFEELAGRAGLVRGKDVVFE